jgi:hypothetical protein
LEIAAIQNISELLDTDNPTKVPTGKRQDSKEEEKKTGNRQVDQAS